MPANPQPITVVIPTRDRPTQLARCLAALPIEPGIELIVVDDGSTPAVREQLARIVGERGGRLLRAAGGGPAGARNVGIELAAGEYICFLDDDCIPGRGWAPGLAAAAASAPGGVASGRTRLAPTAGAGARASQAVIDQLQLGGIDPGGGLDFAPTCNLCCTREVLGENRFDVGYALAGGEDREFCDRLIAAGHRPRYAPEAVVVHDQPEGLARLLKRHYGYGRGGSRYRRAGGALPEPGFYRGLLGRAARGGAATLALVLVAQLATAAGIARERLLPGTGVRDPGGGAPEANRIVGAPLTRPQKEPVEVNEPVDRYV